MKQIRLVGDTVRSRRSGAAFLLIRLDFVEHAHASQPEPARV
jgi:hypothetical protein